MEQPETQSAVGSTRLLATPRTDANEESWSREYENSREAGWPPIGFVVDSDFARELERENKALRDALNLARQHIASEFGFENWRIEQVDRVANVSDQRPGDRDETKNTSSGIAGFAASDG